MILILSDFNKELQDLHVKPVIPFLHEANERYTFFAYSNFPINSSLSVSYQGFSKSITIKTALDSLDLSQVKSIWNRCPGRPQVQSHLGQEFKSYVRGESKSFLENLPLLVPQASWLPSPLIYNLVNHKPYQLSEAQQVGLKIPPTIIGNDTEITALFLKQHSTVIIKALDKSHTENEIGAIESLFQYKNLFLKLFKPEEHNLTDQINVSTTFTQKLEAKELFNRIEDISLCPIIIQAYIPKQIELRITIVNKQLFACAIHSQSKDFPEAHTDYRPYSDKLHHEPYTLPKDIEEKCLLLMEKLNLNFGCIDMIVTPDNEYIFLEINPNGQWLWIEEKTGLPISKAIADFLIQPN